MRASLRSVVAFPSEEDGGASLPLAEGELTALSLAEGGPTALPLAEGVAMARPPAIYVANKKATAKKDFMLVELRIKRDEQLSKTVSEIRAQLTGWY